MQGSYYRYNAPSLLEIQKQGLEQSTPLESFFSRENIFILKVKGFFFDVIIISSILSLSLISFYQFQQSILGTYFFPETKRETIFLLISLLPTLALFITFFYSFLNYFFNQNSSPGSQWYGLKVLPYSYFQDGSEKDFTLTLEQSLKRALANCINPLLLYLPNLIFLVDPQKRNFTDLFSGSIQVSKKTFDRNWASKGSPEYVILINIENLAKESDEEVLHPMAA